MDLKHCRYSTGEEDHGEGGCPDDTADDVSFIEPL